MYEDSVTAVKCAVGTTDWFKVEVVLHQGSALISPFLFAVLIDKVRRKSPWTMMFADDMLICGESREQVEKSMEKWRYEIERSGMKEVCPEKKDVFNAVSLSASTITRRVEEIGGNVYAQLQQKTKDLDFFSLALDESMDVQDTAELLILIRGVTTNFEMCEELAALQSLKGTTTGKDIFDKVVVSCINFIRANELKHRQFQQFLSELESAYGDVLYYTEIRWLSRGKVLRRFYELLPEINAFLQLKGKTVPELIDPAWKWHLAFLTDVKEMLNGLNLQLQGKGKLICDMYSHIKAFEVKLALVLEQVKKHNFTISLLPKAFLQRSQLSRSQNPFVADIDEAQPSYQFELAELQNCDVLKDAFKPNSPIDFDAALPNDTYPNIKKHAMKMSTLFGSTYICERTFSRMKLLKTPTRSRLTDEHLHQCLRLAVTRMELDIQLLTSQMQAHNSH
ncbi:general transcription factor II-I repeat domain-containing protein 2-like [Silurus meridionalis]|nr:general transcription factor II-I repeat domain-containing protein 2-like [Silurus meridionalis]